jgi:hypothetical protein
VSEKKQKMQVPENKKILGMAEKLVELRESSQEKSTTEILNDIVEVARHSNELYRMNIEFYG